MLSKLMLSVVLPLVVYVQLVNAKLRGHVVENKEIRNSAKIATSSQDTLPVDVREPEQYLHDFLEKMKNVLQTKALEQHSSSASSPNQIHTEAVADLSYKNFAVARKRLNSNDCSGPVVSMAARNVACSRFGPMSMSGRCISSTFYEMSSYNSSDCSGEPLATMQDQTGSCVDGMAVQCLASEEVPTFADKHGIYTYKFREMGMCKYFSANFLGYAAPYGSDQVDFDDVHMDDDGGRFTGNYEDGQACCMQSEILQYCPYPACAQEEPLPAERRLLAESAPTIDTARPFHWWEHKNVKKSGSRSEQVDSTSASVLAVDSSLYFREYSLAQTRSNVCAYDETYQIWVKTSCNSEKNTHTYELFADAECHFPMKKVVRPIAELYPQYGKCVESTKGDGRTQLVLCRDEKGFGTPPYEPPMEA